MPGGFGVRRSVVGCARPPSRAATAPPRLVRCGPPAASVVAALGAPAAAGFAKPAAVVPTGAPALRAPAPPLGCCC